MGAATALLAAADEPVLKRARVDSPFADFGEMIERQYPQLSGGLPSWLLPGALLVGRWLSGTELAPPYARIPGGRQSCFGVICRPMLLESDAR